MVSHLEDQTGPCRIDKHLPAAWSAVDQSGKRSNAGARLTSVPTARAVRYDFHVDARIDLKFNDRYVSFAPQRNYWIYSHCLPRWKVPGNDSDARQEHTHGHESNSIGRTDPIEEMRENISQAN